MRTPEEIEQLAEKWSTNTSSSEKIAYKDGYKQCQKDNADKKYTLNEVERYHDIRVMNGVFEANRYLQSLK